MALLSHSTCPNLCMARMYARPPFGAQITGPQMPPAPLAAVCICLLVSSIGDSGSAVLQWFHAELHWTGRRQCALRRCRYGRDRHLMTAGLMTAPLPPATPTDSPGTVRAAYSPSVYQISDYGPTANSRPAGYVITASQ